MVSPLLHSVQSPNVNHRSDLDRFRGSPSGSSICPPSGSIDVSNVVQLQNGVANNQNVIAYNQAGFPDKSQVTQHTGPVCITQVNYLDTSKFGSSLSLDVFQGKTTLRSLWVVC